MENDPKCGLTTGGRAECWWDCQIQRLENPENPEQFFEFITNLPCLEDCYPPDHCLSSLLADYKAAGGICKGSFLDVNYPGLYNTSQDDCLLLQVDGLQTAIISGLCSEKTRELLVDQENCIRPLWSQKFSIFWTSNSLVQSLCDFETEIL